MNDTTAKTSGVILAAGHGERMLPITEKIPKPLLPILGTPLLEVLVRKLLRQGASEIHCNLFHLSARIEEFAAGRGWPLRFHREEELLGTGGGIGNMAADIGGSDVILLHNGDALSDIEYRGAISLHRERGALVTMVLVPAGPTANVAVGADGAIVAIGAATPPHSGVRLLGYTGLAVLSSESLDYFPRGGMGHLVPILRTMIERRPGSVLGWNAAANDARYVWGETGSPSGYLGIHRAILIDRARFDPAIEDAPFPLHAGEGAAVDPGAIWRGFCEIGRRAVVERDAYLEDCVVLEDTIVARGSAHSNEILFPGGVLKASGGR
ncbi:MAG: NDP-sugar synthase [Candidatus Krumholzibacteria bacterium]|nr:NDP-sugar synthase [Candidatus Krumholzibacteria bacterium]